jgi:hypothetical protein
LHVSTTASDTSSLFTFADAFKAPPAERILIFCYTWSTLSSHDLHGLFGVLALKICVEGGKLRGGQFRMLKEVGYFFVLENAKIFNSFHFFTLKHAALSM